MSWQRYPNASYPEAYDEANMVDATDVSVNEAGGKLTIEAVASGYGPLSELTGEDVRGVRPNDPQPQSIEEVAEVEAHAAVDDDEVVADAEV